MFGDSVEMAKPNADHTAPNIATGRHPNLFTRAPASGADHKRETIITLSAITAQFYS